MRARVATLLVLLFCGFPATANAIRAHDDGLPEFDSRTGERAEIPRSTERARDGFRRRLGGESFLSTDPVNGGARFVGRTDGALSGRADGDAETIALGWVRDHLAELRLDSGDLAGLRLLRREEHHGTTYLTWRQTDDGVASYDTGLEVSVAADGRVLTVGGGAAHDVEVASATPKLSAAEALAIAQRNIGVKQTSPAVHGFDARRVIFADPDGDRLAWRLVTAGMPPYFYDVVVDARNGAVLARHSLTDFVIDAEVFENHPEATAGGIPSTEDIEAYLNPSPANLSGPFAHVYADLDDDDVADASEEIEPNSGPDFSFSQTFMAAGSGQVCPTAFGTDNCSWSGIVGPSQPTNRDQRSTQLFYFVNSFHDWLEQPAIGFSGTENFEGADRVIAQTDDGNGVNFPDGEACDHLNNANMLTLPNGVSPIMQMYFFGIRGTCGSASSTPAVNSADDASVVFHEYTHGLSNRLIGNGGGLNAHQSRSMGEGWSDWYAMDYLVANGVETDTATDGELTIGQYVTNDPVDGIRRDAMDCSIGTVSTPSCNGSTGAPGGGYTYGDIGKVSGAAQVHSDGEIWAQTLWDLRKTLGATTARSRITDAMRLTTTLDPSFLDMRDAILLADVAAGSANVSAIWSVFAVRGMGCSAKTAGANTVTATEAFDLPTAAGCPSPAATPAVAPPPAPTPAPAPAPGLSGSTTSVRLDSRGRFTFSFTAVPIGAKGSARFSSAKNLSSRKAGERWKISLGSKSFAVPLGGRVELTLKLSRRNLKIVRRYRSVRTNVSITIDGKSFIATLTIRAPRKSGG